MGRPADWFSAPDEVAAAFVRAHDNGGDEAVLGLLRPYIEGGASDLSVDKLWEPIHRCLTGDYAPAHVLDFTAGEYPLKRAVLGGTRLLDEGCRSLQFAGADEVPDVAAALTALDRRWFWERFFAMPPNQYLPLTEEWFDEVWQYVQMLVAFFQTAAAKGHAAFCTSDH